MNEVSLLIRFSKYVSVNDQPETPDPFQRKTCFLSRSLTVFAFSFQHKTLDISDSVSPLSLPTNPVFVLAFCDSSERSGLNATDLFGLKLLSHPDSDTTHRFLQIFGGLISGRVHVKAQF